MTPEFLRWGRRLRVVPVMPRRISWSALLGRGLAVPGSRPDVIALDLPPSFKDAALDGIRQQGGADLWVVQGDLPPFPARRTDMTGLTPSGPVVAATARLLLQARALACRHVAPQPGVDPDTWITDVTRGFDPFVVVTDRHADAARLRANLVGPENRFVASEATTTRRVKHGDVYRSPLGGRVWYTPPISSTEHPRRARWIAAGQEDHVPEYGQMPPPLDPTEGPRWLLKRALRCCRRHVLYLSPASMPPDPVVASEAIARRLEVVHIPLEQLDPEDVAHVLRDDHVRCPPGSEFLPRPEIEVFPLNPGDARVTALTLASRRGIDVACIDRELLPSELADLDGRPAPRHGQHQALQLEDVLLEEEGLSVAFQRLAPHLAPTRVRDVDARREDHMAWHLRSLLGQELDVLLVCAARHWRGIRERLEDPAFSYCPPIGKAAPATLMFAPDLACLTDDDEPPYLVEAFARRLREERAPLFRHLSVQEALRERLLRSLAGENIIPTNVLAFDAWLARLCRRTGVLAPRAFHVLEAARACLGLSHAAFLRALGGQTSGGVRDDVPRISNAVRDALGLRIRYRGHDLRAHSRDGRPDHVVALRETLDPEGHAKRPCLKTTVYSPPRLGRARPTPAPSRPPPRPGPGAVHQDPPHGRHLGRRPGRQGHAPGPGPR